MTEVVAAEYLKNRWKPSCVYYDEEGRIHWLYVLLMNDMRAYSIKSSDNVAVSRERSALLGLMLKERVEPYEEPRSDGRVTFLQGNCFYKTFRKGGPLEWYNWGGIKLCEEDYQIRRLVEHIEKPYKVGMKYAFLLN